LGNWVSCQGADRSRELGPLFDWRPTRPDGQAPEDVEVGGSPGRQQPVRRRQRVWRLEILELGQVPCLSNDMCRRAESGGWLGWINL